MSFRTELIGLVQCFESCVEGGCTRAVKVIYTRRVAEVTEGVRQRVQSPAGKQLKVIP